MPPAQRLGDINDGGGAIVTILQDTVSANGRLLSVTGSVVAPHEAHIIAFTLQASGTVTAGGIPVNRTGDEDDCGHIRIGGSPDVIVGD